MAAFVKVTRFVGDREVETWLNLDEVAYMNVYTPDPPRTYVEFSYRGTPVGFASDPSFTYSPQSIYVLEKPDEILLRMRSSLGA